MIREGAKPVSRSASSGLNRLSTPATPKCMFNCVHCALIRELLGPIINGQNQCCMLVAIFIRQSIVFSVFPSHPIPEKKQEMWPCERTLFFCFITRRKIFILKHTFYLLSRLLSSKTLSKLFFYSCVQYEILNFHFRIIKVKVDFNVFIPSFLQSYG